MTFIYIVKPKPWNRFIDCHQIPIGRIPLIGRLSTKQLRSDALDFGLMVSEANEFKQTLNLRAESH